MSIRIFGNRWENTRGASYSKTLQKLADKDDRIDSYEFDGDSHWIHLKEGFITDDLCHSIHEWRVADVLHYVSLISECEIEGCCNN